MTEHCTHTLCVYLVLAAARGGGDDAGVAACGSWQQVVLRGRDAGLVDQVVADERGTIELPLQSTALAWTLT